MDTARTTAYSHWQNGWISWNSKCSTIQEGSTESPPRTWTFLKPPFTSNYSLFWSASLRLSRTKWMPGRCFTAESSWHHQYPPLMPLQLPLIASSGFRQAPLSNTHASRNSSAREARKSSYIGSLVSTGNVKLTAQLRCTRAPFRPNHNFPGVNLPADFSFTDDVKLSHLFLYELTQSLGRNSRKYSGAD